MECALLIDVQVNTYPSFRGFTAIGTGGDDFVDSMVVAVESVLEMRVPRVSLLSTLPAAPAACFPAACFPAACCPAACSYYKSSLSLDDSC